MSPEGLVHVCLALESSRELLDHKLRRNRAVPVRAGDLRPRHLRLEATLQWLHGHSKETG